MVLSNSQQHNVPFEIEGDNHVQDYQIPNSTEIEKEVEDLAEAWQGFDDLIGYIDHGVNQIRNAQALAKAAEEKAAFAMKTAKGFKGNIEYRRGTIEAALNAAVSRGLLPAPKVKSNEYSLGIQGTAGSTNINPDLDLWREDVQTELDFISNLLLTQIMSGSPIELTEDATLRLAKMSHAYAENCDPAQDKDFNILSAKTVLTWDRKYLAQAIKNNWLTEKLAGLFTVIKGKALVIRL